MFLIGLTTNYPAFSLSASLGAEYFMSHLMNNYSRLPVAFTHGEGVWMFDDSGKRYLDALSGIAVNTLGHAHPRLTAALSATFTASIAAVSSAVASRKMSSICTL